MNQNRRQTANLFWDVLGGAAIAWVLFLAVIFLTGAWFLIGDLIGA